MQSDLKKEGLMYKPQRPLGEGVGGEGVQLLSVNEDSN